MRKTAILIAFLSSNAFADDLAPLSIFGGQEASEIAGSSSFIGDEELKKSGYTDTERIMGRVPGVFSQTEDGLGLRTNIGMRGVNPNRTTKLILLKMVFFKDLQFIQIPLCTFSQMRVMLKELRF